MDSTQQIGLLQSSLDEAKKQLQALDTDLKTSESQKQGLESQLLTLQKELNRSHKKLKENEEKIFWSDTAKVAANHKSNELTQLSQQLQLEMKHLNEQIKSIYDSKSWRITSPLRRLQPLHGRMFSLPARFMRSVLHIPVYIGQRLFSKGQAPGDNQALDSTDSRQPWQPHESTNTPDAPGTVVSSALTKPDDIPGPSMPPTTEPTSDISTTMLDTTHLPLNTRKVYLDLLVNISKNAQGAVK